MKFGLTGTPLGHSYSKIIHSNLFSLKNVDYNYELYPTENLDEYIKTTLSKLDGFNVTIPYKKEVIKYLNEVDKKVDLYDACNTVAVRNGKLIGYNTDVDGFLNTLKKYNIRLKDKKVLVLGSGGVSRMMTFECSLAGAQVYITSRNIITCNEIKEEVLQKLNKKITVLSLNEIDGEFDILLNGTPCGMYPNILSLAISFEKVKNVPVVIDTIYNPAETLLTRLTKYCGNICANGDNMLIQQAAAAQKYFCDLAYTEEEVQQVIDSVEINPFSIDKNIILIGPPGSGKTTVGKEISKVLNMNFVDIDAEIEKEYGKITNIFQSKGEKYFRELESQKLLDFANKKGVLISTGGGIVENKEVMEVLSRSDNNIIMFINPSYDLLLDRTKKSQDRPLLLGDIESKLQALLKRRIPLYNKYSNYKIDILKEQPVKDTVIQCIDKIAL